MTGHGPYETREQALEDARPLRAASAAADPGGPVVTDEIRARRRAAITTHIDNALHAAGINLAAYDAETVEWLSLWEPETIQVILSWPARARAAAEAGLRAEISELNARIEDLATKVRHAAPIAMDHAIMREIAERRTR